MRTPLLEATSRELPASSYRPRAVGYDQTGRSITHGSPLIAIIIPLSKIISGGQTGVDRGALDATLAAGFPCGGWCPEGRLAEDGAIADRYPIAVLSGAGYEERTLQNVLDSDGTALLHTGKLEGGTRLTAEHCVRHGKPHVLIDASTCPPDRAAREIAAFVERERVSVLNIAGPRASKWPGARDYAYDVVDRLLRTYA